MTHKPLTLKLTFQSDAVERLMALKKMTEADGVGEVIKNALQCYEHLIKETERGKTFFVRDESGLKPLKLWEGS